MASAGLIFGKALHHLDHLAPLCALYGIPLILTDPEMVLLAQNFYLDLEIIEYNEHEAPEKVVANFDRIVYTTPRVLFDEVFYFAQAMHNKRVQTLWCPHGSAPFMEALAEEEILLTYGSRMNDLLEEKGVQGKKIQLGNYRYAYYKKHKAFYDGLLPEKKKTTLLYAPTWQDEESNSSFEKIAPLLADAPKHLSLIVKLHPNLYIQYPNEVERLRKENIFLLEHFPPVYPILSQTDLLMSDVSSVCYDFLSFKRPILLFKDSPLREAALHIEEKDYGKLFEIAEELLEKGAPKNTLYEETFSRFARKVPILTT